MTPAGHRKPGRGAEERAPGAVSGRVHFKRWKRLARPRVFE
jgi:hypothetical protein